MKPYQSLSLKGKLRRLHGLALAALTQYDLAISEVVYHRFDTNLLYRLTASSGERFILRLAYPGWRSFADLWSEAAWLDALARDTGIPAPRVIQARSGERVLPMLVEGVPDAWNVTLMSWLPGRLMGHSLTERNLEKMGVLFAALHQHGAAWTPPDGFTTRRFEHWLSRGEENLIVDTGNPELAARQAGLMAAVPTSARDLLEKLHHRVESAYAAIDRADLRVIHCDLWHDNIKLHQGVLYPFDFEDTVWGFRAHDIAMAMLDLLETVGEERYVTLLAAFRRGYSAQLSWPDDPIEPLQVGRLLWKVNWVARRQPQWLVNMIERHLPVLEHYARTGKVIRSPVG